MSLQTHGVHRFALMLAVSVMAIHVIGCESSRMPLAKAVGKVTLSGQPLPDVKVVFRPDAGPAASGETDADGRFDLSTYAPGDGAVIGRHSVIVVPKNKGVSLMPGQPPTAPATVAHSVPRRYQRHESSELTAEVTESGDEISLDLNP